MHTATIALLSLMGGSEPTAGTVARARGQGGAPEDESGHFSRDQAGSQTAG